MIQFQENAQTDGRTDGRTERRKDEQTLFYRTLPTTGDPKSNWKENINRFWTVSERLCALQIKMMKHQDFKSKLDGMK